MPLVTFLVGLILSASTEIGDKINAAMQLVGMGKESAIPDEYKYLTQGKVSTAADGTKVVYLPEPHEAWHMPWWLALVILLSLYIAYRVWRQKRRERLHNDSVRTRTRSRF